jgi:replicative DNA helicase
MTTDVTGWEEIFLGSVISDPKSMLEAQALHLMPADFTLPMHATIFKNAHDLYEKGSLSQSTLAQTLRSNGILSDIGTAQIQGEQYIHYLVNKSDIAGTKEAADWILDASTKRRVGEIAAVTLRETRNGKLANEIIEDLIKNVLQLRRVRNGQTVHISNFSQTYKEQAELIRSGQIKPYWYPPLDALKKRINHMANVDFALMVGKPGTGKSSLLRYLAIKTAVNGNPAMVVTLENSHEEYYTWAIAMLAGINHSIVIDPSKQSATDMEKIDDADEQLRHIPIFIHELGIGDLQDVASIVRQFKMQYNDLSFVGVDGVYLMKSNSDSTYETISQNTQGLRSFAQEIHVPIVGTTQFSRRVNSKEKAENSDILYGGENAARQLWLVAEKKLSAVEAVKFPWNRDPNGKLLPGDLNTSVVTINVSKNTNGPTGFTDEIQWDKPTNTYKTLVRDWRGPIAQPTVKPQAARSTFKAAPKPVKKEKQKSW